MGDLESMFGSGLRLVACQVSSTNAFRDNEWALLLLLGQKSKHKSLEKWCVMCVFLG